MKRIFHIIIVAATAAAQAPCGSESQILFQSNAYASSIVQSSYQGLPFEATRQDILDFFEDYKPIESRGSLLQTQEEWDSFVDSFQPNYSGETLARTSIDFSMEKVVVGTYYTTSTCNVDISHAQLQCATTDTGEVWMKMIMDVFDASLDCDMKCMSLGQVVFAVAVPLAWEIDEDTGYHINVIGPCSSGALRASPDAATTSSLEAIVLDSATTGVTTKTTQSSDQVSTSSSASHYSGQLSTSSSASHETKTGATSATASYEEFDTNSNEFTSLETTSIQKNIPTEPVLIEKSQLPSTAYVEDVTILIDEPVEIADQSNSIELDKTTTTPVPKTDSTATMAIVPVISDGGAPTTSPTAKTANEPENGSSSLRLHYLILSVLLSAVSFL